jgi:translation initiation factor IF-2
LGLKAVPPVGSLVTPPQEKVASVAEPETKKTEAVVAEVAEGEEAEEVAPKLRLIIKADVAGTLEAIIQNLGDEVELITSGIGNVSESDVLMAQSTGAKILAFRVKPVPSAKRLAEIEEINIKAYSLIHELLDDVSREVLKILEPTIDETVLGEAKITAEFTVKGSQIAGVMIESGKLTKGDRVHLMRKKVVAGDSRIKSIHQGKDTIDKAKKGEECGLSFSPALAFQPKDKLVAYSVD